MATRHHCAALISEDEIFVSGMYINLGESDTTFIFNLETGAYSYTKNLPSPGSAAAGGAITNPSDGSVKVVLIARAE